MNFAEPRDSMVPLEMRRAPLSTTVETVDALQVINFEQVKIIIEVSDATMGQSDCQQLL